MATFFLWLIALIYDLKEEVSGYAIQSVSNYAKNLENRQDEIKNGE